MRGRVGVFRCGCGCLCVFAGVAAFTGVGASRRGSGFWRVGGCVGVKFKVFFFNKSFLLLVLVFLFFLFFFEFVVFSLYNFFSFYKKIKTKKTTNKKLKTLP